MEALIPMPDKIAAPKKTTPSARSNRHQQELLLEHQALLEHAINELQQLNHISDDLKQRVPALSSKKSSKLNNSEAVLASMTDVLGLYQSATTELNNERLLQHENSSQLIKLYVEKLTSLANDFHLTPALHSELDKIYQQLKNIKTINNLCHSFQEIISLLILSINGEKEASKFFLEALNSALLDVKSIVADGSSLTKNSSKDRKLWDSSLKDHVDKVSSMIGHELNATSQSSINTEIAHILAALKFKEKFDQQETQHLLQNFQQMEQQLKAVEAEAQGYKTRLEQQEVLSMQDSLTKLPNRAALDKRFEAEFNRVKTTGMQLWVVVADLDFFKIINDTYGHSAGDKTLQVIASVLSASLRDSEFVARFGGEEFVILVPDISKIALSNMLNRVRKKIKSIPFKFKNCDVQITISMGATQIKLSDASELFAFERADQALYKAKNRGRDQIFID